MYSFLSSVDDISNHVSIAFPDSDKCLLHVSTLLNLHFQATEKGTKHIICASGGNAGLAAAYSARKLNVPITIFVPESTGEKMRERLRGEVR